MRKLGKVLPIWLPMLAALVCTAAVPAFAAGLKPASALSQDPEILTAQGELVKVDLENKTLTIKTEKGDEMSFQYDSNTSVEGKEKGVEGLSSESGTSLVVRYKDKDGKKLAIKIEIKKAEG